jgi:hypothetical protein
MVVRDVRLIASSVVLCVAILVPSGLASARRGATADDISDFLLGTVHGTSVSDWRARTPGATWQRYRDTAELILESPQEQSSPSVEPSGFWCAVATDHHEDIERVAVFFALRDTEPAACRIELLQGLVRRPTEQQAAELFRDLSAILERRLSAPARPVDWRETPWVYGGGTGYPVGVSGWKETVTWHEDQRDTFLFRADGAVGFASRSTLLTPESEEAGKPTDVAAESERQLADALRNRFPDAAAAMSFDRVPLHQAEIRRALIDVLDARTKATAQDQPVLAFAADRLARKLWIDGPEPSAHRELAPLLRRGLRFVRDPYEDLSLYDGSLVASLLRRWSETEWGQIAFATRLYEGWTEDACDGGAYENVIRQGDAWLRSHPESPRRVVVMTAVARAYETKWAVNRRFTADPRENARLVTPAEASARRRAIELYDAVIRLAPTSPDAMYARRRIVQLRANMTTSQDVYSCVYA